MYLIRTILKVSIFKTTRSKSFEGGKKNDTGNKPRGKGSIGVQEVGTLMEVYRAVHLQRTCGSISPSGGERGVREGKRSKYNRSGLGMI